LIAKLTLNPARILGVPCGLAVGAAADIAILDPCTEYVIDATMFKSRSRNSPFCGMTVRGKAVSTIVGGKVVFEDNR
jgi:dihydroorotase